MDREKEAQRMNLYEVVGTLGLLVVVALLIYMAWTIKKMPEEAEKP